MGEAFAYVTSTDQYRSSSKTPVSSSSSSGSCKPAAVVDELLVRERRLRVVIAPAKQRVTRKPLEVPPVLLGVLAVVSLGPRQAEHSLLEDRVAAVPEREREAELVADVGDAGHPVLVPAVGARPRVVVGNELHASPLSE